MIYRRTLLFLMVTLLALLLWGCSGAATPATDTGVAAPVEEAAAPEAEAAEEAEAEAPAEAAEETEAEAPAEAAEAEAMGEPVQGGVVVVGLQKEPFAPFLNHLSIIPGAAIFLVVLALNFLGNGLCDALDPRLRE
jgi:hypothetical protein